VKQLTSGSASSFLVPHYALLLLLVSACVRPHKGEFMDAEFAERFAVRELIDHASDAVNHHEWETLLGLSTADVVWERRGAWTLEGRDRVLAFLTHNDENIEIVSYSAGSMRIDLLDRTHARVRSTLNELIRFKATGAVVLVVGTYEDSVVREERGWRIARRTITPRGEWTLPLTPTALELPR
jgi:hypothetical protein